ncbi:hypothetical protein RRG08_033646 [Elysia crispata]|uniref:Uncharacterized protein n=1 Tax=Elysia crispata TaxID=231223 RepID=A0AAE0XS95_9GAST|nr:hypothetical protein RRG08_033646 [Elysia crispata]
MSLSGLSSTPSPRDPFPMNLHLLLNFLITYHSHSRAPWNDQCLVICSTDATVLMSSNSSPLLERRGMISAWLSAPPTLLFSCPPTLVPC